MRPFSSFHTAFSLIQNSAEQPLSRGFHFFKAQGFSSSEGLFLASPPNAHLESTLSTLAPNLPFGFISLHPSIVNLMFHLLCILFFLGPFFLAHSGGAFYISQREVTPVGDVTWLLPSTDAAIVQCYPLDVKFTSPVRPVSLGVLFVYNETEWWIPVQDWERANPDWQDGSTEILVTIPYFALPAGSLTWLGVLDEEENESFLQGTGYTVQASNDDSCLPNDPSLEDYFHISVSTAFGTMTGQSIFTTVTTQPEPTATASATTEGVERRGNAASRERRIARAAAFSLPTPTMNAGKLRRVSQYIYLLLRGSLTRSSLFRSRMDSP
ncbi:hypothetical protein BDY24DRAFT_444340, partial [Mrakia frigida]|uniref:uncharacterized protein n=1 Tax=Mrakia frigida TaxID=29902 RepID=UPI003FCC21CD